MDKVTFQKAKAEDISALVSLRIAYLMDDYAGLTEVEIEALESKLPEYFSCHLERDLVVYVAKKQEEIVSCVFLLVIEKPSNPSFLNGRVGNVLNVYTKPQYRRKGYAFHLMKMLVLDAEKRSLDFVELKSTDSGLAMYRKLGFEEEVSKYRNMKLILNHS